MQSSGGTFFSPATKGRIRETVRQAVSPSEMEKLVYETFGDDALHLARQIAAEEKGLEWLRQGCEPVAPYTVTTNSNMPASPPSFTPSRDHGSEAAGRRFGHLLRYLWKFELVKFLATLLVIGIGGVVAVKYSNYRQARDFQEELASIGPSASVGAAAWAAATRSCNVVGIPDIRACAVSTGPLLEDTAAKAIAGVATKQADEYLAKCQRHYAKQYCLDLFNRAFRISLYTRQ